MAIFNNMRITDAGKKLYAKAQAGKELHFTKMKVGCGDIGTRNPDTLLDLVEPKYNVGIQSISPNMETKSAVISGMINNGEVKEPTYICEIGLFAQDPDEGEILYGYANSGQYGDYYAPNSVGVFTWNYQINAAIGNAANVTVELSNLVYDYGVINTNSSFINLSGGNQKEINKSIDNLFSKLNENMKKCYSLSDAVRIPANSDLNDYRELGNYVSISKTLSPTLINSPFTDGGFTLKVERCTGPVDGSYVRQTIITNSHYSRTFVRNFLTGDNGVQQWSEWREVAYKESDKVLFNGNVALPNTIIELADSVQNYKKLRFTLVKNGQEYKEVPAHSSGFCLRSTDITSGSSTTCTFFEINISSISDTKLKISSAFALVNSGGTMTKLNGSDANANIDNFLKITKIVGVN